MKAENVILQKSKKFAVRIVKLYQHICDKKNEYVMSKQLYRSGTSIWANIKESVYAQSVADFINKMSIALKEAAETEYWLEILHETGHLTDKEFNAIITDCIELKKMLTKIINSSKNNLP